MSKELLAQQMDPSWFHVCFDDVIFQLILYYNVINSVIINEIQLLYRKLARLPCSFFILHIRPILHYNFCYYRCVRRYKMIFHTSKVYGSRAGASELLTTIRLQKCQFLPTLENWTNWHVSYSCKWIINNECLVYVHSLDFRLNIHKTNSFAVCGPSSLLLRPISTYIFPFTNALSDEDLFDQRDSFPDKSKIQNTTKNHFITLSKNE